MLILHMGMKVPEERRFLGMKGPGNESSRV